MTRFATLSLTLLLSPLAMADNLIVDLGTAERAARLFSYPNCLSNCPAPDSSLEQTVSHWLSQSVQRDGYTSAVRIYRKDDRLYADLNRAANPANKDENKYPVPDDYSDAIRSYLDIGDIGYAKAEELKKTPQWQSSWRFFLTLGMALRNHNTVQLLHFPPDTVLNDTQDYLSAATTVRWGNLLGFNGVDVRQNGLYQTIDDIAPIAAPANAGAALEGVYDTFTPYTLALMQSWTAPKAGQSAPRPMVVLGSPARQWLAKQFKLGTLRVLDQFPLDIGSNKQVPVAIGNHPSLIWNAGSDSQGISIMRQDLTVACWQAAMGKNPAGDAKATMDSCTQTWKNEVQACRLYYTSIKNTSYATATQNCAPAVGKKR
jgi:hypothetical protein